MRGAGRREGGGRRAVLAWRLSNTLGAEFWCRGARESARALRPARDLQYRSEPALAKAGGSPFTSEDFTGTLKRHEISISIDGRGVAWTTSSSSGCGGASNTAKAGLGAWLSFYNEARQHQSLGYRTPRQAYEAECPWICGRSAKPTGSASPTSRASSESGKCSPSPTYPPAQPSTAGLI
jgi:putative transposase